MPVFAFPSNNQGGRLDVWSGGADMLIGGLKLQCTKSATSALKFRAGLIAWGLVFLVCRGPRYFLSLFFGTAQLIS